MEHSRKLRRRLLLPAAALVAAALAVPLVAVAAVGGGRAAMAPIKVGVLSDCQGAFGPFYEQDIGGVIAAFSEFTGAKPVNPNKPSAGMKGGSINGHPIKIVGFGCSNDRADKAISETRRLMEQLGADVMIGPLSGDESIAVANYAKSHPNKTFVNGSAGAQDTTLKVRAKNFFRFNGDGAMWNAGLGDIAKRKLGWKTAAVIADDYSFAWTSAAGFIADFCAAGGKVTKRVFPPLNTTDYSSFVQQLPNPNQVDGYFWGVGGTGLIPALKAFEQAKGQIAGKSHVGNLFWGTPGQFEQLGQRVSGVYVGEGETAPDLRTPSAIGYAKIVGKWFKSFPPFPGAAESQAGSIFTYAYYNNAWGLIKGLKAVGGDLSGGQKKLQQALTQVRLDSGYGSIRLDKQRNAVENVYIAQLYTDAQGKLALRTAYMVPNVDQSFGGTFSTKTPAPGRNFPPCVNRKLPWLGKEVPVLKGVPNRAAAK